MTSPMLGTAEIDRELARRTAESTTVGSTLLELDRHPGIALVRRYPPEGETARRWAPVEKALGELWDDLARVRAILTEAETVRGRGRIDDRARARLTELLRGRPHEIARIPVPLAQRGLTGPSETVVTVGIADCLERMHAAFAFVAPFAEEVAAVDRQVLDALAPLQQRVERADGALAAATEPLAALLRRAGTDPLGFAPGEIDSALASLTELIDTETTRNAEFLAVATDLPAAVEVLRARLADLADAQRAADDTAARAERKVDTGPIPPGGASASALLAELATLSGEPIRSTVEHLLALRARAEDAAGATARRTELAQGLLDRRAELRGRLAAYRAKASRLGVAEERDVLAADRIASGLLTRTPCDLAAVTRAVADYRSIIGEKAGRTA
ncbi:hypothetical protein [Nocardia caishijiensis]|uniref:Uncharacterized protein n=1 Tax=Nocardia caishijiensis TaxID=184756 RepID=A0ABQ6YGH5_9NOCA|nr:hypothetical protein [Nocardia caishijiensis]KAF0844887.1 hypothetical protein FNL39_110119 [Nocardia caishijiensis]